MVRFLVPFLGAAALLSSSSLAAPMGVRQGGVLRRSRESDRMEEAPMYEQPEYEAPPKERPMCDGRECPPPMPEESALTSTYETSTYETSTYETSTYEASTTETSSTEEYTTEAEPSSTEAPAETTATYESSVYPMPSYGSGHGAWGGYEDCVQQCMAQYGAPPNREYTPPAQETRTPEGGRIHYVMVAPVDGVPKYMPYAINATVGDTVRFVWPGTVEHSVTMGTELNLCSKNQAEGAFDSGLKSGADGEQTFDVVIETEDPQYFYCTKGDHCSKGMWGIINPKTQAGGDNTIGSKMSEWAESNPDIAAAWAMVHNTTKDTPADTWGDNIVIDDIPEEQYLSIAANTMYTRATLAANPGMQALGLGAISPDGSPIIFPADVSSLLAEVNGPSANTTAAASSPPPAPSTNGALPVSMSSAAFVSLFAVLAGLLAL